MNERIITPIEGEHGVVGLVKVGATIVGKIKVDYSDLSSNSNRTTQLNLPIVPERVYHKGDEIGRFQLGSTVILLFEKNKFKVVYSDTDSIAIKPADILPGTPVKVGQIIGSMKN
mgnify:CR=1 FL=1